MSDRDVRDLAIETPTDALGPALPEVSPMKAPRSIEQILHELEPMAKEALRIAQENGWERQARRLTRGLQKLRREREIVAKGRRSRMREPMLYHDRQRRERIEKARRFVAKVRPMMRKVGGGGGGNCAEVVSLLTK
jgi:hypothetical protein